ncbi:MAG: hypothetical protein FJW36_07450 [Acidobacteria bacterium]|nr:hypothetical protein [Acidobacteriota bacterium]
MKLKRRELLVATVGVAAAQPPKPQQGGDLVELARQSMKSNREAIAKVKVDIAVEPAFVFKA